MILYFTVFFALMAIVSNQRPSPCPEIFAYESRKENNRWYGIISLKGRENLTGIWLHLTLDRPADLLGNWFGQVSTCNNIVFIIRKPGYILVANFPLIIRFFVKFNPAKTIPSLEMIKLNGNTICSTPDNQSDAFSMSPIVQISQLRPENVEEDKKSHSNALSYNNRPSEKNSEVSSLLEEEEDDDSEVFHFAGDFNIQKSLAQSRIAHAKVRGISASCGIATPRTDSKMSQDKDDIWPGQWPWQAALYYPENSKLIYLCGATLISEQHVIVPAHCVTIPYTERPLHANKLLISLGKFNLNRLGNNTEIQDRSLSNIQVHPEYNSTTYLNNLAILKLSKPIQITNFVRPCCLWQEDTNSTGKEGTIVGWGSDENSRLMHDRVLVAPTENCIFSESTPDTYYCAEFRNGSSACKIISVGGMIFPKEGTSGQNTVWQIRGINVYSEIQDPCDKIKYKMFTDLVKYSKWINDVITRSN